jgi:CDP-6-deoxy-D-xylo-4-hexulose-3-dehydrase
VTIELKIQEFLRTLEKNSENSFPFVANKSNFDPSKDSVFYSGPYWDNREITAVIKSIITGVWLTSGEQVNRFERAFSKKFSFTESVMVNSGSSANLIMIAALKKYYEWNDQDEIILSAVGFPTTASAVIQNNLKPVFVDITWDDLNWDLNQIEKLITNKTKAVFSSPVLGNSYNMDRLIEICSKNRLEIIADNCDSLGSKWDEKFLTEYAIAASCSFYPAHHISTMEGGMVSSKNAEIIKLARSFAWWGRACYCVGKQNLLPNGTCKARFSKWIDGCDFVLDHKYVFDNIGYNLKPLDLQGAVGQIQLDKFDEIDALRKSNKEKMDNIVNKIPGTRVVKETNKSDPSWFGAPIVCNSSELKYNLVNHLEKNRIQTRNYFAGNLLQQPAYKHLGDWKKFPNSSEVISRVFFLGVSPTINNEMLAYVESVVDDFIDN